MQVRAGFIVGRMGFSARTALHEHLGTTLGSRIDNEIVACSALELHVDFVLLRSVAVDKDYQGTAWSTTSPGLPRTWRGSGVSTVSIS